MAELGIAAVGTRILVADDAAVRSPPRLAALRRRRRDLLRDAWGLNDVVTG
jgi:hypothetical protein